MWIIFVVLVSIALTLFFLRSPVQCLCQKSASNTKPPVSHPEAILDDSSDASSDEDAIDDIPAVVADLPEQEQEQEMYWGETPEE